MGKGLETLEKSNVYRRIILEMLLMVAKFGDLLADHIREVQQNSTNGDVATP